ncbi:hypothetical protein HZA86_05705 [Candidatus Uhrbacteria bacterium]|nr:hypothetical protein [Candidatus Uhrbacteria bacterium]
MAQQDRPSPYKRRKTIIVGLLVAFILNLTPLRPVKAWEWSDLYGTWWGRAVISTPLILAGPLTGGLSWGALAGGTALWAGSNIIADDVADFARSQGGDAALRPGATLEGDPNDPYYWIFQRDDGKVIYMHTDPNSPKGREYLERVLEGHEIKDTKIFTKGDILAQQRGQIAKDDSFIDGLSKALIGRLVAIIGIILGIILEVVSIFFKILLNMIAGSLLALLQFNNFSDLPQIGEVWKLMRDLANMFFIIILLLIAFGTILRVEKYNWKSTLPKLLIMAVLINFSRTIAGFIIDVSQVIMLTFYNSIKPINDSTHGVGNFQAMFAVGHDQIRFAIDSFWQFFNNLGYEGPMLVVAAEIMSFMYLVTGVSMLFTMLGMLAFRIVALWVLVMLSPLAFFLSTFPQGEEYSSRWWKEFANNVIVGPVLAFFLWLALYVNQTLVYDDTNGMLKSGGFYSTFKQSLGLSSETTLAGIIQGLNPGQTEALQSVFVGHFDLLKFLNVLLSFTLLTVGMMVAQEVGSAGAKQVGEWAGKINSWGTTAWSAPANFVGGGAFNWVDRTLAGQASHGDIRRYLAYLSPTALKKGYEGYMEEEKKQKFTKATGMIQNTIDKRMNLGLGGTKFQPLNPQNLAKLLTRVRGVEVDGQGNIMEEYEENGEKKKRTTGQKLGASQIGYRVNEKGEKEIVGDNAMSQVAKGIDSWKDLELWKGHAGLAETIAEEELINHEVSQINASDLDPSSFAGHMYENMKSGNFARASAYARVAGFQNWGDDVANALYTQFGMSFTDALSETDRLSAESKAKTLDIFRRNKAGVAPKKIEGLADAKGLADAAHAAKPNEAAAWGNSASAQARGNAQGTDAYKQYKNRFTKKDEKGNVVWEDHEDKEGKEKGQAKRAQYQQIRELQIDHDNLLKKKQAGAKMTEAELETIDAIEQLFSDYKDQIKSVADHGRKISKEAVAEEGGGASLKLNPGVSGVMTADKWTEHELPNSQNPEYTLKAILRQLRKNHPTDPSVQVGGNRIDLKEGSTTVIDRNLIEEVHKAILRKLGLK